MSLNVNKYITLSFPYIIIFLFIFILHKNYSDDRNQYESYLLSMYNQIPDYTEDELESIPKPEHPHAGKFQDRYMTLDPNLGYVPRERLNDAFLQTKSLQNLNRDSREIIWNNVQSNMGGRTRTAMYDPNDINMNKVWAGSVSGGLWYNNNINDPNSSWSPVNDFWDNISISKIIYDSNNTNIFYVSTGEANTALVTYRESSSKGIGIWKTVDAGASWNLIESTFDFQYITDIEIRSVNNSSEIYACVASGVYQGTEHNSLPNDGLYKSIDGGYSWNQVLPNIPGTDIPFTPSDIEITSDGKLIIGTFKNIYGQGGANILTSNTGEPNSWTINNQFENIILNSNNENIPGRVVISSCKNSPEHIYAVIGAGFINNMGFNLSYGNYIIKSNDYGITWTSVNLPTQEGNEWASLAWHALDISVHPDNHNIIFIGGLELYRSDNGGDSWTNLSDWSLMYYGGGPNYIHADIHDVIFNNYNPSEIIVVTDGGIFHSNNSLDSQDNVEFSERNFGYNTLQFYTCDIAPVSYGENVFIGGLQDNGTLITGAILDNDNAFDINDMITGGDGAYCFFDDNDPILITSTYYNAWYFINSNNLNYTYSGNNNGVFINPSDYDSNVNTLYANKVRFNGTQNQRIIKIDNINTESIDNNNINVNSINLATNTQVYYSAIKKSTSSNTLYIGTQSGRLFKIINIDTNPITYEIGSVDFPLGNISSIDLGSSEENILVTFSNYGVSSVWLSNDNGTNWHNKEGNLPDMPIRWGLFHPDNNNRVLLATEINVWETSNINSLNTVDWLPSNNNFPNVRVDMLSIRNDDNLVLAATHGRGLFYGYFNDSNTDITGDINLDNQLNVLDIVLLVNLILDEDVYNEIADINFDNMINVLDIVLLVNLILEL